MGTVPECPTWRSGFSSALAVHNSTVAAAPRGMAMCSLHRDVLVHVAFSGAGARKSGVDVNAVWSGQVGEPLTSRPFLTLKLGTLSFPLA
jgi:hypothetical protein